MFVNPPANHSLQPGSPCIDAGDPYYTYNDRYFPPSQGTVRNDMGYTGGPYAPTDRLMTDTCMILVDTGGIVNFTLDAGAGNGNSNYHMLCCVSGTEPGLDIPNGPHLPLNWDFITDLVIKTANSPVWVDFRGTLDPTGVGTAQFNTNGPLPPGAAGVSLYFAYLLFEPVSSTIFYASNPVWVNIVP
jgi:hypothetical protein